MNDPRAGGQSLFEVEDLSFRYGRGAEAVRGVSFTVGAGEMLGLIGPNGAGKSTLLHLMNGLLKADSGEVRLEGTPVARIDPRIRARRLGYVPQAPRVLFPYTVAEIVAMGRHPHLAPMAGLGAADRERVRWSLEVTGTTEFAGRLFNELSGGEAQRVILARALAQDAPCLLLDEPTSSLDLYYQAALYGLLERLNRERGLTVLVVTHDINLAAEYCPRLIGMRAGRIVMDGTTEQIVTPERIGELYGVKAKVIVDGGVRFVRVRHHEDGGAL